MFNALDEKELESFKERLACFLSDEGFQRVEINFNFAGNDRLFGGITGQSIYLDVEAHFGKSQES